MDAEIVNFTLTLLDWDISNYNALFYYNKHKGNSIRSVVINIKERTYWI